MKQLAITLGFLLLSLTVHAAPNKGMITCSLKSFAGVGEEAKLLATDTQPNGEYGTNLNGDAQQSSMSFAVSLGRTSSLIINDASTGQTSSAYLNVMVIPADGVIAMMTMHNSSEGSVVLVCSKE